VLWNQIQFGVLASYMNDWFTNKVNLCALLSYNGDSRKNNDSTRINWPSAFQCFCNHLALRKLEKIAFIKLAGRYSLLSTLHQSGQTGTDSRTGHSEDLKNPSVLLPLTRHQCIIRCETSCVAHGAAKRRWAPLTTHDTPEGVQSEYNKCFF